MQINRLATLLVAFFVPFLSFAQNPDHHLDSTGNPGNRVLEAGAAPGEVRLAGSEGTKRGATGNGTVSVHELSIPGKARRAFEKGLKLWASKDTKGSIAEFEHAIAYYPAFYEAYFQLGKAEVDLQHSREAAEAFSSAIRTSEGRFAPAYFALALVLCRDSNFAEADTLAKTGLTVEPSALLGVLALGLAELGLGRLGIAEKAAREVLAHNPNSREGRLLLIEIHGRGNKLPEVVEDVEAYLKLDSGSAMSTQLRRLRDAAQLTMARPDRAAVVAKAQP